MKILAKTGNNNIATVYIAELPNGKRIEFVESTQPPQPRGKKWVLIISSLYGCCVKCLFCDAGGSYQGVISKEDLFRQIDFMVTNRFPDRKIPVEKFKIQFARMGEPAFNPNVADVLREFPQRYGAPGFIPSVSTVAPRGCDAFFEDMLQIRHEFYKKNFQLQFSIHTTDQACRDRLIPVRKWDFRAIADYGKAFYREGSRKITLNFALADDIPFDAGVLERYFPPEIFLIKITPVNPTYNAVKHNITSEKLLSNGRKELFAELEKRGYDCILSIGDLEENQIGSNCGQYLENYEQEKQELRVSYNYRIESLNHCATS